MRRLILVLAVLSLFSSTAVAQTSIPADRIANAKKSYERGLELTEAGQFIQAVDSFRQAVQFDPEYADAYAALGRAYFKLRDWQKAIDNLNRAARLNQKQRDVSEAVITKRANEAPKPAPVALKQNTAAITQVKRPVSHTPPTPKRTQLALNNAFQPQLIAAKQSAPQIAVGPPPATATNHAPVETSAAGDRVALSAEPPPPPVLKETTTPTEAVPLTKIYRVGPNDVLDVRLNNPGQESTLYTVTAAGLLEHPLLNEPMTVAGLTVEEIADRLANDLRKRAIIEDPRAVVGVRDYASHAVLVSGLVKDAGTKFLRREAIPLYVVVADAQPLPEAAKVTVVRNESNQIHEIELGQAVEMNFLVRAGDVITLSPNKTQFIYIGGEIKLPGEKTFRRGLTLMQAILAAGGSEDKAKIAEISRDNGEGYLVPTRYKLKEIVSGKVVDPLLKPGDRISILR